MSSTVHLLRDDALGADALAMIAESEAELAGLYAPEHRYAFSPDQLLDAGVHFLVAYAGDRPVGCGGYADCGDYGELKRIFVSRDARGQRLAGTIVAALEDAARSAGLTRMRLETGEASPEALRLYARLGYARIGPFGTYEDNGSSIFMEKPL